VLAYGTAWDSGAAGALQWWARSLSPHGGGGCLPRRHRPHFGKGETDMNATRYLPFAGRLLIGLAFAMSGLSKLAAYGATVDLIASSKLPLPSPLAYAGAVMVELGCGVLMIAGYQARAAAGVLALFCVATAVFFHTNFTDPNQIFHFIKNVVMTGGLLQIVAFGAGALSIDNRH
jgi:putative oxidoreductase